MKKTLKRAGAVGLAAATIVTGLSFGPAASADQPAPAAAASTPENGTKFPFVGESASGKFYAMKAGLVLVEEYATRAAAVQAASTAEVVLEGDQFRLKADGIDRCYHAVPLSGTTEHYISTGFCRGESSLWHMNGETLVNTALNKPVSAPITHNGFTYFTVSDASPLSIDGIVTRFVAKVDSVDIPNRTAQISGTAVPRAYVVINGDDQVQAGTDGRWEYQLRALKLGSNPVTLEQYEGTTKTSETTIDAELKVAPVAGAASFPADHEKDAVLSGTAQPGSTVIVTDVNGEEIARAEARLGSGTWSTPITAPNAGGDYDVRVRQEIDGEATPEIVVTVAYGAAVQITAPVEGMAHDGGPVTLRGTGEIGAQVAVREQGRSTVLGTAQVLANGQWTVRTTNVDDRKHILEATQSGKGHNTTVSTVTLNPEAGEIAPVTVTNPADASAGYTPNTSFTFEGTGTAGKTLAVENKFGTTLGSTTVLADGTWSWTRANMGTSNWTINFIQDKGETSQSTATVLNFKPSTDTPAPTPLVTVTNPADATDGYVPNTSFTFEGTGTAGKTLAVENKFGTPLGSTTVLANGTWSWTRANMGTSNWTINFIQDKGTSTEAKATVANFAPSAEAPAPAPLVVVTNPADATDGYVPNTAFTFTGTATAGKTLAVENKFGTPLGTTTVNAQGAWSWTRANMGTSIWSINFIQDKGTDDESMAQVVDFAPRG